jgi:hypothetical protein
VAALVVSGGRLADLSPLLDVVFFLGLGLLDLSSVASG